MATKTPATGRTFSVPSSTLRSRTPVTVCSPSTSATVEFHSNPILGLAKARSCMTLEARSRSRRWTTVTLVANLVRNVASSRAESPPPTTTSSRLR